MPEQMKPVAEVVSKYGDPESFGEREVVVSPEALKLPYGTKLYAIPADKVLIPRELLTALLDGDSNVCLVAAREIRALMEE
ncbi:hypothetical protein D3C76_520980 [compost metagenome]